MRTRFLLWGAMVCALSGFACGDDEGSDTTGASRGDAGASTTEAGGRTATRDGAGSSSVAPGGMSSVACGSKTCTAPGGGFAMACCVDAETETCGTSFMGAGCSVPDPGDTRCPSVMSLVTLPACCTDDGMCGINAAMFGMPGCIELSEAASRAQMSSAASFPEPRRCDATGPVDDPETDRDTDTDAGVADEDGGT